MKRIVLVAAIVVGAPATALASRGGGGGGGGHSGGGGGGGHSSGGGGSSAHSSGGGGHSGGGGGWHGGGGTTVDHRGSSGGGGWHGGGGTTVDHRGGGYGGGHYVGGHYAGGVWIAPTYVYDDSGYYGCSEYGCGDVAYDDGAMPTWTWELGGMMRAFRGPSFTRMGTVIGSDGLDHGYTLSSGTPVARDSSTAAADIRASFSASEHIYLGGEVQLGGLVRSPLQISSDSDVAQIASTTMFGAAAVAGVRTRMGAIEIGAELAGGVRSFTTTITSDTGDTGDSPTESITVPLAEARLRGAVWLTPQWFIAAQLGSGLLDRSDVSVAFMIGSSTRPYAEPFSAQAPAPY